METGKNGQSVIETLKEGLFKEGAKDRANFAIDILEEDPILFDLVPDEKCVGGLQMKVVIPVFIRADQLRDFEVADDDDPNETHGPLSMIDAGDLLRYEGLNMPFFHRQATLAVLAWSVKKDIKIYNRYDRFIHNWIPIEHTQEELEAKATYLKKWQ